MEDKFEVRDHRNKQMFRVDDEYLNGYAKLCGVNATLVYLCLCRHADRYQESFPSVTLMAEKTGVSRDSVIRGIKMLIEWNIISKERERKENAQWLNNRYVLLDKSVWKNKPSSTQQHGSQVAHSVEPSRNDGQNQVAHSDTKVTHKKDTHIKIATQSVAPFSLEEEIKKLDDNPRRDLNIIAMYFEERNLDIKTAAQFNVTLKRHIRAAQQLKPFTDDQIQKAVRIAKKEYPEIWTVETLVKIVTK